METMTTLNYFVRFYLFINIRFYIGIGLNELKIMKKKLDQFKIDRQSQTLSCNICFSLGIIFLFRFCIYYIMLYKQKTFLLL